jgi:hypothetical protein
VLGTDKELKAHYELMKKFPEMEHSDPNQVTVAPGQTGEVIWQFTRAGKVDFACLQPGHYDAGMKGVVRVAQAQAAAVHAQSVKLNAGGTAVPASAAPKNPATGSAATELVEIEWNASNAFERTIDVGPGKFAELCGKLTKDQSIAWSFKAPQPLDFNIHFHEGKNVVFPVKRAQVAALEGEWKVVVDQDYCWMWENKSAAKASVTVELHRH